MFYRPCEANTKILGHIEIRLHDSAIQSACHLVSSDYPILCLTSSPLSFFLFLGS